MTVPTPPAGLDPLGREPTSLYPPFVDDRRRWAPFPTRHDRYIALLSALDGVELGSYDVRILHWLAGWEPWVVAAVCSLIHRARSADSDERTCS